MVFEATASAVGLVARMCGAGVGNRTPYLSGRFKCPRLTLDYARMKGWRSRRDSNPDCSAFGGRCPVQLGDGSVVSLQGVEPRSLA